MINPKDLVRRGFHRREMAPNSWAFDWKIPGDLPYFSGHFPENPTLPAVAMIDLTVALLPITGEKRLSTVKSAKFMVPLHPGMAVVISGVHDASAPTGSEWRSEWRLENGDVAASLIFGLSAGEGLDRARRQNPA
jgi:3-hydroxymyristoyl/3-hydroxydecanoyl-(acyl carrier protein) dehydratase